MPGSSKRKADSNFFAMSPSTPKTNRDMYRYLQSPLQQEASHRSDVLNETLPVKNQLRREASRTDTEKGGDNDEKRKRKGSVDCSGEGGAHGRSRSRSFSSSSSSDLSSSVKEIEEIDDCSDVSVGGPMWEEYDKVRSDSDDNERTPMVGNESEDERSMTENEIGEGAYIAGIEKVRSDSDDDDMKSTTENEIDKDVYIVEIEKVRSDNDNDDMKSTTENEIDKEVYIVEIEKERSDNDNDYMKSTTENENNNGDKNKIDKVYMVGIEAGCCRGGSKEKHRKTIVQLIFYFSSNERVGEQTVIMSDCSNSAELKVRREAVLQVQNEQGQAPDDELTALLHPYKFPLPPRTFYVRVGKVGQWNDQDFYGEESDLDMLDLSTLGEEWLVVGDSYYVHNVESGICAAGWRMVRLITIKRGFSPRKKIMNVNNNVSQSSSKSHMDMDCTGKSKRDLHDQRRVEDVCRESSGGKGARKGGGSNGGVSGSWSDSEERRSCAVEGSSAKGDLRTLSEEEGGCSSAKGDLRTLSEEEGGCSSAKGVGWSGWTNDSSVEMGGSRGRLSLDVFLSREGGRTDGVNDGSSVSGAAGLSSTDRPISDAKRKEQKSFDDDPEYTPTTTSDDSGEEGTIGTKQQRRTAPKTNAITYTAPKSAEIYVALTNKKNPAPAKVVETSALVTADEETFQIVHRGGNEEGSSSGYVLSENVDQTISFFVNESDIATLNGDSDFFSEIGAGTHVFCRHSRVPAELQRMEGKKLD
jgi:hypothetical protein